MEAMYHDIQRAGAGWTAVISLRRMERPLGLFWT
jgi:hypothetical protein